MRPRLLACQRADQIQVPTANCLGQRHLRLCQIEVALLQVVPRSPAERSTLAQSEPSLTSPTSQDSQSALAGRNWPPAALNCKGSRKPCGDQNLPAHTFDPLGPVHTIAEPR